MDPQIFILKSEGSHIPLTPHPEPIFKKEPVMTSLMQLYIASLTVIGLFIVFKLSLAK